MKAQTRIHHAPPAFPSDPPAPAPAAATGQKVTIGRIVNYVLKDGQVRPLMVVRVWGDVPFPGYINGVLIFDGSNDANVLPFAQDNPASHPTQWLTSIHYDPAKKPGTWHWPERV